MAAGQLLRTAGMWTAAGNFAHHIAQHRDERHVLVTHGVYSVFRHPAYTGWTWWAVGSQLMLANPVCVCLFAAAAVRFFAERIPYEEMTLVQFFGAEYVAYAQRTWVAIPFVRGSAGDWQHLLGQRGGAPPGHGKLVRDSSVATQGE